MKNHSLRVILAALVMLAAVPILTTGVLLPASAPAAVDEKGASALEPEPHHRFASRLASRFVTSYHYRSQELDSDMSERIFEQYLSLLDPNRSYFTADDIADLERYRDHLAEAVKTADLEPAYDIFNLYTRRVGERTERALELVESDFDFTVEESYRFDRREADWAPDRETLDEIWRKRVKNDWLRLKLADQDEDEIRETLTERYANIRRRTEEFNSEDVFSMFMNAFIGSVEPHSAYMSPRRSENFEISMRLSLEGIGAMLQRESEYTTVMEIVPGGPADLDGRLEPGDRIVGVAQGEEGEMVDVVGWRLDDVVDLIRGDRDTVVRLEILPSETGLGGPSREIDLTRNEVKLEEQAASSEVIEVPDGDDTRRIGVIRVPVFYVDFEGRSQNKPNYRSSTRDVRKLIGELESEGVDGLIVDLRGNGGGALVEATTMTGLFIDTGPVVQVRDSRGNVKLEEDKEPGMAWDGPLAVLVDRRSASASEIFAAAIQDYGRGVIIGEPTFGKGTVQNLIDLDSMSRSDGDRLGQLKLTMAQFYRVAGGSTQAKGVEPDISLPWAGDPDEWGERGLDFAMPWTEIDEAEYRPVADLSTLIEMARVHHEERRESDEELARLLDDLAEWEDDSERESVSLVESVRREELEKAEARRASRYGDSDSVAIEADEGLEIDDTEAAADDEEEPDVYLTESARILSDLIRLDGKTHLLAHRDHGEAEIE